jgi:hypothetical protein
MRSRLETTRSLQKTRKKKVVARRCANSGEELRESEEKCAGIDRSDAGATSSSPNGREAGLCSGHHVGTTRSFTMKRVLKLILANGV